MNVSFQFAGFPAIDAGRLDADLKKIGFQPTPELLEANSWTWLRGRHSSIGKLVMAGEHLKQIENQQACRHALTIRQGSTVQNWQRLCVIKTEAIYPRIVKERATDSTPYLVTIGDGRHDAMHATLDTAYNYRGPTNRFVRSTLRGGASERVPWRAKEIVEHLWRNIEPIVGDLTINADDQDVEGLSFWGASAWDALWELLDHLGWSMVIGQDGQAYIFELRDEAPPVSLDASKLLGGSLWLERPTLPARIVGTTRKHDYQWDKNADTDTAADYHRINPTYEESFLTLDLLGLRGQSGEIERLRTRKIVPFVEGSLAVWGTMPAIYNDQRELTNEQEVNGHLRDVAKRYVQRRLSMDRHTSWDFAGGVVYVPDSRWGSVVFREQRDGGNYGGLATSLVAAEVVPESGTWKPHPEFLPGPREIHDREPYGRQGFATIVSKLTPSSGNEDIEPNEKCIVSLMAGADGPVFVRWRNIRNVVAVNCTGRTIKTGRFGFVRWNYQLATGGMWCIVSVGGSATTDNYDPNGDDDLADWASRCISEAGEVNAMQDPGLVIVNRRSMLRLLNLSSVTGSSRGAVGIDFRHGPDGTVLATEEGTMWWHDSPQLKNLSLTGRLGLGSATLGDERGGQHLLPGPAGRSHRYLIAERTGAGGTTHWGWSGPGLDCKIQVVPLQPLLVLIYTLIYDVIDHFCDYMGNCGTYADPWGPDGRPTSPGEITYDGDLPGGGGVSTTQLTQLFCFTNGLMTESSTGCRVPSRRFGSSDVRPEPIRFNPCVDGMISAGDSSPGESPDQPDPVDDSDNDPGGGPVVTPDPDCLPNQICPVSPDGPPVDPGAQVSDRWERLP